MSSLTLLLVTMVSLFFPFCTSLFSLLFLLPPLAISWILISTNSTSAFKLWDVISLTLCLLWKFWTLATFWTHYVPMEEDWEKIISIPTILDEPVWCVFLPYNQMSPDEYIPSSIKAPGDKDSKRMRRRGCREELNVRMRFLCIGFVGLLRRGNRK